MTTSAPRSSGGTRSPPIAGESNPCCQTRKGHTKARSRLANMEKRPPKLDALMLAFNAYMSDRRQRPLARSTRYDYTRRVRRTLDVARASEVSLLAGDARSVRLVLGHLSPHPTTQTGYIAALQCFYEFLIAQGLREDNPAKFVGRPPTLKHQPRPLDHAAAEDYLEAATAVDVRHEALAVFGLYQGWRRSEIRFSQWSWFFRADGRIWCDVTGKGSKTARVSVHPRTQTLLDRLRASHTDPVWLLPSPVKPGEPIGGTWMSAAHHRICVAAGLPTDTRLHQLRHTYATYLRAAGADQALVQRGLRHADPKSTAIYMEVFPEELASMQDRLDFQHQPGEGEDATLPDAAAAADVRLLERWKWRRHH